MGTRRYLRISSDINPLSTAKQLQGVPATRKRIERVQVGLKLRADLDREVTRVVAENPDQWEYRQDFIEDAIREKLKSLEVEKPGGRPSDQAVKTFERRSR